MDWRVIWLKSDGYRFLNGSTENVYLDFCSSKSVTPESSTLPNGVKIYWLGSKSAKYVFLYFHGMVSVTV